MRVELSAEIFTEDGTGFNHVIRFMQYFTESRHDWVVTLRVLNVAVEYFRRHTPFMAQAYELMAHKGMVSQAWTGGPSPQAVQITADSLSGHAEDLGRPAQIVVENQQSDRAFVLALAHVFSADRIIEADKKGWLEFAQAGGSGEVPKVAKAELARFQRIVRVVFLLDSDRMVPDGASKHDKTVVELRDLGVSGHVLAFREVENYVPNKILSAVPGHRAEISKRITHLKELTAEQRAHFDFKAGFWSKKERRLEIPSDQRELYRSLSPATKQGLIRGFGEGLSLLLEQEAKAGNLRASDFGALGPGVCEELRALLALLQEIV